MRGRAGAFRRGSPPDDGGGDLGTATRGDHLHRVAGIVRHAVTPWCRDEVFTPLRRHRLEQSRSRLSQHHSTNGLALIEDAPGRLAHALDQISNRPRAATESAALASPAV
jgi:hypothetical protein